MPIRTRWELYPPQPQRAEALARQLGVLPPIAQALLNRGYERPAPAAQFLASSLAHLSDPLRLPDMDRALARLRRAVRQREVIGIFGDSDVDGITASAILSEGLRALGARVLVRLSNRVADGYGFPAGLIRRIRGLGLRVVVLVDCGTNQRAEIDELSRHGIDVIVFDHHLPTEHRARPFAMVNARLGDEDLAGLCSAGISFKAVQALCPEEIWRERLDLAALGTLADYAPLVGDNRIMVQEGLPRILATRRPGLRRLCEDVRVTQPSVEHVLKRLVPRLNASGRMGRPRPVWQLLVETSEYTAYRLADRLAGMHDQTKTLSRRLIAEAHEQASRMHFRDQWIMVVGRSGWHPGLMGPLAAQLVERFQRPAIAIAFDGTLGVGSGRAGAQFNLFEALEACRARLVRYGGHPQACGLTIKPEELDAFRLQINQHAHRHADHASFARRIAIDAGVTLGAMTTRLAEQAGRMAPFGNGNPPVRVVVRDVKVEAGRDGLMLRDPTGSVRVRGGPRTLACGGPYDMVLAPTLRQGACVAGPVDVRRLHLEHAESEEWDGLRVPGDDGDEGENELRMPPARRGSAP